MSENQHLMEVFMKITFAKLAIVLCAVLMADMPSVSAQESNVAAENGTEQVSSFCCKKRERKRSGRHRRSHRSDRAVATVK